MNQSIKFPFYAKLAFTLITLISIFVIFYFAKGIITPLLISLLFAILLGPLVNFLRFRLRFPNVMAVLVTILLFVAFFAAIITFLSWQISDIVDDWTKIKTNINIHLTGLQEMIRERFNLSQVEQKEILDSAASTKGREIVGNTILSLTDTLLNLAIIPIYTFLILLYRTHFMKFLCKLFNTDDHTKLQEIASHIRVSVQSYITGLMIQMVTVSVLTTIGYMILGIKYAILLGVITGLLNLIPYLGIFTACVLSILATLGTSPDVSIILGVVIVNAIVQFIDNNFLVPMIISSKVEMNALVSIVGIIVGGAIAGIAGMFLAIPILAITKVIFDRIDELKPWGYLMGDDLPRSFRWRHIKLPTYTPEATTDTINIDPAGPKVMFTETVTSSESEKKENT